jgi:hypothetical protein
MIHGIELSTSILRLNTAIITITFKVKTLLVINEVIITGALFVLRLSISAILIYGVLSMSS